MMETEMISARLAKDEIAVIIERAKEEKTDRTTALRRIFGLGARQYRLEKAVKQYEAGKISFGAAAKLAGTSIWEMMDELKRRGIANPLTKEDYAGSYAIEKLLT